MAGTCRASAIVALRRCDLPNTGHDDAYPGVQVLVTVGCRVWDVLSKASKGCGTVLPPQLTLPA